MCGDVAGVYEVCREIGSRVLVREGRVVCWCVGVCLGSGRMESVRLQEKGEGGEMIAEDWGMCDVYSVCGIRDCLFCYSFFLPFFFAIHITLHFISLSSLKNALLNFQGPSLFFQKRLEDNVDEKTG
jgi:hypothetical protein